MATELVLTESEWRTLWLDGRPALTIEMMGWAAENGVKYEVRWGRLPTEVRVRFSSETDAMLFKLRWR